MQNDETEEYGYQVIDLITNEKVQTIECSNFGASGAALFDKKTGTMIVGGLDGVLYTAELGKVSKVLQWWQPPSITLEETIQEYHSFIGEEDQASTAIDGSVAMYHNYLYYGNEDGILQCVDANKLTPIWAIDAGDQIISTPALDMNGSKAVNLYTANAITSQDSASMIRKLNALTGEEIWAVEIPGVTYSAGEERGVHASPVVGERAIDNLVFYTVSKGSDGSEVFALSKVDGATLWTTPLETTTISSPVAVYNEDGVAWIIQAESDGSVHLMEARSGKILDTLKLEGTITASPAVYQNYLIIGTSGEGTCGVHCIRIN